MKLPIRLLSDRVAELERRAALYLARRASSLALKYARYHSDPCGFASDVLGVVLTPDQAAILKACGESPWRVKIKAGHSVGKTFLLAVILLWWYCTRGESITITTAPTERDVIDLLWSEVRRLARRADLPVPFKPAAPEIFDSPDHYAKGYTARKGESFQGRHAKSMLFLSDESEGLESIYYRTTNTMFVPGGGHLWVDSCNPTTTTSESHAQEWLAGLDGQPVWNLITLSCLTHPNVVAGLAGLPEPVPGAVTVGQVDGWVAEWCDRLPPSEPRQALDFEWRPGAGDWFRPGPLFLSRVLGLRPTSASDSVWGELDFDRAASVRLEPAPTDRPELGVDVARFGLDWSVVVTRRGPRALSLETWAGNDLAQTTGRVAALAERAALDYRAATGVELDPREVLVKIDDDGVGGGVTDFLRERGYSVRPVQAGGRAADPAKYPRRRDELWFVTAERARGGELSLAGLDRASLARLKQQALAPRYRLTSAGQRQVESKDEVKARTKGRSPDDLDGLNLAFAEAPESGVPTLVRGRGNRPDHERRRR